MGKAKFCLNLESYLNKAIALESLQVISDSLCVCGETQATIGVV